MRVETRESGGIAGPAKWVAVGALGGAAVMGVIGAMIVRQPRTLVAADRVVAPLVAVQPRTSSSASTLSRASDAGPMALAESAPSPASASDSSQPKPEALGPAPAPPPIPSDSPKPLSVPSKSASTAKARAIVGKINVNKATQAELELLPRVGPALAQRIIEYRNTHGPFHHIEDLDKVKGIGPKTLEKLRPLVTIE